MPVDLVSRETTPMDLTAELNKLWDRADQIEKEHPEDTLDIGEVLLTKSVLLVVAELMLIRDRLYKRL